MERPNAILLDLMLPDKNGYQICEEVRRFDAAVPILMLTARSQEADKISRPGRRRGRLRDQALQLG